VVSRDISIYAPLLVADHHFPDSALGVCSMDKTNRSTWGKKVLIFIAKFLLVSLPLFVLWLVVGYFYISAVLLIVKSSVAIFGQKLPGLPMSLDLFSSPIPFISLIVITKGIKLQQRLFKMGIGLLILFSWHLVATMFLYLIVTGDSQLAIWKSVLLPSFRTFLYIFNLVLPFLLWFYLLGKTRIKRAIL